MNFVDNFIEKKVEYLNYNIWAKDLILSFGKENVCILPMEEISQITFWTKLCDFATIKNKPPEYYHELSGKRTRNVRKKTNKSWAISPFDPNQKAKLQIKSIFNLLWSHSVLPEFRKKTRDHLAELNSKRIRLKFNKKKLGRDTEIYLTEKVEEKIMSVYKSSNKELGEILDKDLSLYHYY